MLHRFSMPPKSHTFTITLPLPPSVSADTAIGALHLHSNTLTLHPLVVSFKNISTNAVAGASDAFFSSEESSPIKAYEVTESVQVVPGIGSWGKKTVTFPAIYQDTTDGVKTRADATGGVIVKSQWHVRQNTGASGNEGNVEGGWELAEDVTFECPVLLMPFVKRSAEDSHRKVCERLIEIFKNS